MKIALAQMRVLPGNPEQNVATMESMITELMQHKDIDVVAFPEMCIPGYFVGDKWNDKEFCQNVSSYNDTIIKLSKIYKIIIIWGNVYINENAINEDGRIQKFNAAYIAENGVVSHRFKTFLPNYRMFDDKRYFSSNPVESVEPYITTKGEKIGIELCEDLWERDYKGSPTRTLAKKGACAIINISASPFGVDKDKARDNAIKLMYDNLLRYRLPFFYVNCVGVQDNGKNFITFDGDSRIYDQHGEKAAVSISPYETGFLFGEVEFENTLTKTYKQTNQNSLKTLDTSSIAQKYRAIIETYKYIFKTFKMPAFIFGLSGGIDSAVSCALAVEAVGANNVIAYNLPSKYNSDMTKGAAAYCAKKLGIRYEISSIEHFMTAANTTFGKSLTDLDEENAQSRTRGFILQTYAGLHGGVVVSNGNKIEIACGYTTYLGDDVGIFSPLGDLTKVEIFEMAKFINKRIGEHIIPTSLIPDENLKFGMSPSAELKNNQKDPFFWYFDDAVINKVMSYKRCGLTDLARAYFLGSQTLADLLEIDIQILKHWNILKINKDSARRFFTHIEWLFNLMAKNVFKRIQAPPIVVLSKSAFGYDYRESQIPFDLPIEYLKLKEKVLSELI